MSDKKKGGRKTLGPSRSRHRSPAAQAEEEKKRARQPARKSTSPPPEKKQRRAKTQGKVAVKKEPVSDSDKKKTKGKKKVVQLDSDESSDGDVDLETDGGVISSEEEEEESEFAAESSEEDSSDDDLVLVESPAKSKKKSSKVKQMIDQRGNEYKVVKAEKKQKSQKVNLKLVLSPKPKKGGKEKTIRITSSKKSKKEPTVSLKSSRSTRSGSPFGRLPSSTSEEEEENTTKSKTPAKTPAKTPGKASAKTPPKSQTKVKERQSSQSSHHSSQSPAADPHVALRKKISIYQACINGLMASQDNLSPGNVERVSGWMAQIEELERQIRGEDRQQPEQKPKQQTRTKSDQRRTPRKVDKSEESDSNFVDPGIDLEDHRRRVEEARERIKVATPEEVCHYEDVMFDWPRISMETLGIIMDAFDECNADHQAKKDMEELDPDYPDSPEYGVSLHHKLHFCIKLYN